MCINVQRFESTSFLFPHHDDIEYGECVVEIANSTSTTFDQIVWIIFWFIFPSCTRVVKKFFSTKIHEKNKKLIKIIPVWWKRCSGFFFRNRGIKSCVYQENFNTIVFFVFETIFMVLITNAHVRMRLEKEGEEKSD